MSPKSPEVRGQQLYLPTSPEPVCSVSPISLRKEQRRRGTLWYAYKRNHGVLHKRYVGKSAALTSAKLDEVAVELSRAW
jgi:hypothetical protein